MMFGEESQGINIIDNKYDWGTFMAQVQVGTSKNWAKKRTRPYQERRNILKINPSVSCTMPIFQSEAV